jgi:hypothetical protein
MKKHLVLMLVLIVNISYVFSQPNPFIRQTRNWTNYGVQISSMEFDTKIFNLVARTTLELSFKDTDSPKEPKNDSMEVTFNFNLPANSVVDSLYLWINGNPQHAALKERWKAVRTYNQIVGARMDPALLQKMSDDNYNLRIFPFSTGQERKVKICYSTPVSSDGDKNLFLEYPIDMARGSSKPVNRILITTSIEKYLASEISMFFQDKLLDITKNAEKSGIVRLTYEMNNITPVQPIKLNLMHSTFKSSGMAVDFNKKPNEDMTFMALIEPSKIITNAPKRPKNVIFVWNMVYFSDYWYNRYSPITATTVLDTIHEFRYNYYYNQIYADNIKNGVISFVNKYLNTGDRINIIINDGKYKSLYSKSLTKQNTTITDITNFINGINKNVSETNCLAPIDFYTDAIQSIKTETQADLVFIDQTYSYQFPLDSAKIKVKQEQLLKMLPANTTLFGLIGYNWNNPVAQVLNHLIDVKSGMAFYSWGNLNSILTTIGNSLTPYIDPASIVISTKTGSFTHSITKSNSNHVYVGVPLTYFGKIYGKTDSIQITFNGIMNGQAYTSVQKFPVVQSPISTDYIEKLWAAKKVEQIIYQQPTYALNEYKEATLLSLKYRILTQQTALLALEPGMFAEDLYIDDQNKIAGDMLNDGNIMRMTLTDTKQPIDQKKMYTTNLAFMQKTLQIRIELGTLNADQAQTLKIFDLKGKLIADLSKLLPKKQRSFTIALQKGQFASGTYLLQFQSGNEIIKKTIAIMK